MLGGAALTRRYVEEDCVKSYEAGRVAYARDAFDGLDLMDKIVTGRFDTHLEEVRRKNEGRPVNQTRKLGRAADPRPMRPVDVEEIRLRRAELTRNVPVPEPPFWGPRTIERVPAKGGRALPQRAHALPIPVGLPEGRPEPRRVPRMGQGRIAPGLAPHARHRDPRGDPRPAGGLRLLAVRRRRQRRDPLRHRWRARADPLLVPAPEQGGRALHRRFLPRRRPTERAT